MNLNGISIVIATKGRVKLLEDLLISVKEARSNFEKPSEVLLVDDSKAEDVVAINEMCKKYDARRIEFGPSVPEKRNVGAREAQYDIVLFLDSDCIATPNLLNEHYKLYTDEKVGGVAGYLEFVGDSVMGMIVTEYLYKNIPSDVGTLSKLKASLVSTENLCEIIQKMGLNKYILVGKSMAVSHPKKIYADVFEAIVAAMYFDGGFALAKAFVLDNVIIDKNNVDEHLNNCIDYKTTLQEFVQKDIKERIDYVVVSQSGKDHEKQFLISVLLGGKELARCSGFSKKDAEQKCAKEALEILKNR